MVLTAKHNYIYCIRVLHHIISVLQLILGLALHCVHWTLQFAQCQWKRRSRRHSPLEWKLFVAYFVVILCDTQCDPTFNCTAEVRLNLCWAFQAVIMHQQVATRHRQGPRLILGIPEACRLGNLTGGNWQKCKIENFLVW